MLAYIEEIQRLQTLSKTPGISKKQGELFRNLIWKFYEENPRDLPWRKKINPYRILVSEIMLQQTQVKRVIEKYPAFLSSFPTLEKLSNATLAEVIRAWQGLGYNRRAKSLKLAAECIHNNFNGKIPKDEVTLRTLPGIGSYTASAVIAFAFNKRALMLETNIRTVLLHCFFPKRKKVSDSELLAVLDAISPEDNARDWNYALMDFGSYLKSQGIRLNKKVPSFKPQSKFKGSERQVRGAILRHLSNSDSCTLPTMCKELQYENERVLNNALRLEKEGLIRKLGHRYMLA